MSPNTHSGRSVAAAVLLTAVALVAAAGCTSQADDPTAAPARAAAKPAPGPSLTAEEQAAVDAAWAVFQKLNSIYVKAGQTGSYNWAADSTKRPLYQYAGGRYMAALERDLDLMHEQGLIRTGEPKVTLRRVVSISETSIVVETCVDDTGTDTVNKTTRKSVAAPGQNRRYPVTLRAGLYADGLWRWVDSRAERASSC
jgi:hypothetical protein